MIDLDHINVLDPAPPTSSDDAIVSSDFGKQDVVIEPKGDAVDVQTGTNLLDVGSTISGSQEKTRAKIAWTFTQIFLLLVIIALLLPILINIGFPKTFADPVETAKSLLTVISSVLAGPFGFIVGFYFKQNNEG